MAENVQMESMFTADLIRCINFAAIKHKFQRRKDREETPYINHPIGVAHILANEAGVTDLIVIQAALLHDTLEDTDTSYKELSEEFSEDVAVIVMEVSDNKSLPKEERKRLQVENSVQLSHEAKLVRLADKLYNLHDLNRAPPIGWSDTVVREYFNWAFHVVNGCRGTNRPMEYSLDKLFLERNVS